MTGALHTGPLANGASKSGHAFVARLNIQGSGQCSAVLIRPNIAVTAAHCLRHPVSGRNVSVDRAHLLFGYEKGAWIAHRRARAFAFAPGHVEGGALGQDWVLLHFDQPITEIEPAVLRATPLVLDADEAFSAAGYGAPRKEMISVRSDCALRDLREAVMSVGCALSGGASGGPVLDAEGRLAGVIVAISGDDEGEVGLAAVLTPDLIEGVAASLASEKRASLRP